MERGGSGPFVSFERIEKRAPKIECRPRDERLSVCAKAFVKFIRKVVVVSLEWCILMLVRMSVKLYLYVRLDKFKRGSEFAEGNWLVILYLRKYDCLYVRSSASLCRNWIFMRKLVLGALTFIFLYENSNLVNRILIRTCSNFLYWKKINFSIDVLNLIFLTWNYQIVYFFF